MSQFFKFYASLTTEPNLTPAQMVSLTFIFNRMESSKQHIAFYDQSQNDYFVIFTNDELATLMHISASSVKRLIDKSVADGFLTTKILHNRIRLIFMTAKSKQLAGMDETTQPVQFEPVTKAIHNNIISAATVQSEQAPAQIEPLIRLNNYTNTDITTVTKKPTQKPKKQKAVKVPNHTIINNLLNTLKAQVGLSDNIMAIIQKHFNSAAQIYSIMGLLFKAKAKASVQLNEKLRFEDDDVTKLIENNLYSILLHAKNNKKIKNQNAYIYKALLKMFIDSYGDVATDDVKSQPTQQRFNRGYHGYKPRIEKRPAWLQPGYQAPELSDEEYAQYQAKIDCLMKKLALK